MKLIREECILFLMALQFMTRCPIPFELPYTTERMNAAARYYPLTGIIVGAMAALIYTLSLNSLGVVLAVLLSTTATILFTGAFHEDGFADTCDGIGGQTREHTLEIMRDSRLGTYGTVGLVLIIAIKIAALIKLPSEHLPLIFITAHALSRLSSVLVIATSHYVRDEGTGKPTAAGLSKISLTVALGTGLIALYALARFGTIPWAYTALIGLALGHILMRLIYQRKLGGYTGDCLGAVQQLSELGIYLVLVASM